MPADMRNEEPMYLVGLCLRACYDNPLFTEDDDRGGDSSKGGPAAAGPRGPHPPPPPPSSVPAAAQQDGRVAGGVAKDYLHSLTPGSQGAPGEIRFARKKRRRFWLKVGVLGLFLVVVLALVVGLIVHFMHARDSSSLRTSLSPVIRLSRQLKGSLTIVGGPFSVYKQDYQDVSSVSFSLLLKAFQFKMDRIFTHSSFKDVYNSTDILRVGSGSMVVHFMLHLRTPQYLSPREVREMTSLIQDGLRRSVFDINKDSLSLQPEFTVQVTTGNPSAHCEEVRLPKCVNMTSYPLAAYPNLLGHPNQEVAGQVFNQMGLNMLMACHHGSITSFLCALFVPKCGPRSAPVPPCRAFCLEVYNRCNGTMAPGLTFPVDCYTLPDSEDPDICMANPYTPHCEEVRLPKCVNMTSYQLAAYPNLLGHPNQEVAGQVFNQMGLNMLMACHHGSITSFLCALFVPKCGPRSAPVPPCKAFCLEVYNRCNGTMPPGLTFPVDCSTLPDSEDPDICMANPYTPGRCVPIRRDELCLAEGFNSTAFPNLLGSEGEGEVVQLLYLIKGLQDATACYRHAMLFACAAFLPPCSHNHTLGHHNIPPCRSLCLGFRSRCEIFMDIFYAPWPEALACDRLPDSPDPQVCVGYKEAHQPAHLGDCKTGEMRCDRHRCIQSSWVCDGYRDCEDNSDETHCASCLEEETRCSPTSTLCINTTNVCDGHNHCYEAVDEADCVRIGEANDSRILEVHNAVSGQWEEVCSRGWNRTLALLTCKQLGYSAVLSHSLELATQGRHRAALGPLQQGAHPDRLQSYLSKGYVSCPDNDQYVVKVSCWDPVCGIRPANYDSPLRVVGGEEVKPGTWPWLVSMHGGSDRAFFCGASLISPDWVLTAGHCVGGGTRNTSYWTLVAGHTRRPAYSPYRQFRKPKKLFLHPEFNHMTVNNDIALIQLEQPFVLSDYLRPVCLPQAGQAADIGTRCYVAGWGKVDSDAATYQPAVREVNLDVVTWESCMEAVQRTDIHVPYKLTHNMFCAGGAAGHDACQGDSGGPFMCRIPNTTDHWYQAGIVSWGIKCAIPNAPGIYTKLPLYVDWIRETMQNNTSS